MPQITDEQLRQCGLNVRATYSSIAGECYHIALDMKKRLFDEYHISVSVRELRIGDLRDIHFVNVLSAEDYADDASAPILIDASLDQFCIENSNIEGVRVFLGQRNTLPTVGIFPPGNENRTLWYHKPNCPDEFADPLTSPSP